MTFVRTNLGDTQEGARYLRVEKNAFPFLTTNVQTSLQNISAVAGSGSGARRQRSVTSSPVTVQPADNILNVNLGSAGTCQLPAYATRSGIPITFKMFPGSAILTVTPSSPDTFDGQTIMNLVAAQTITFVPYNDGVNAGYAIE